MSASSSTDFGFENANLGPRGFFLGLYLAGSVYLTMHSLEIDLGGLVSEDILRRLQSTDSVSDDANCCLGGRLSGGLLSLPTDFDLKMQSLEVDFLGAYSLEVDSLGIHCIGFSVDPLLFSTHRSGLNPHLDLIM